jgi:hypothetical protein
MLDFKFFFMIKTRIVLYLIENKIINIMGRE